MWCRCGRRAILRHCNEDGDLNDRRTCAKKERPQKEDCSFRWPGDTRRLWHIEDTRKRMKSSWLNFKIKTEKSTRKQN